jgi:hypothetical protein
LKPTWFDLLHFLSLCKNDVDRFLAKLLCLNNLRAFFDLEHNRFECNIAEGVCVGGEGTGELCFEEAVWPQEASRQREKRREGAVWLLPRCGAVLCGLHLAAFVCLCRCQASPLMHDGSHMMLPQAAGCCQLPVLTLHAPAAKTAANSRASHPACASPWSPRRMSVRSPPCCCWCCCCFLPLEEAGCCLGLICAAAVLPRQGRHVVGVWSQTEVTCALAASLKTLLLAIWPTTDTQIKVFSRGNETMLWSLHKHSKGTQDKMCVGSIGTELSSLSRKE